MNDAAKRLVDVALAGVALVLLSPLMAVVAVAVRIDSAGPVLFRQERVGRAGRPFRIHKFRTMVVDAERRGLPLTVGDDRRITRVGRFLRRHRLDELPQLVDIIKGDMSLVGPRPELPRYVATYPPHLRERALALKPGLTDPASLANLDESERLAQAADAEREYIDVLLPAKLELSIGYAQRATVVSDLRVLAKTIGRLLGGGGR
jgi:lipopolysaccharide/colanic/teichoic acid biosynthesis glycosyltransferase